MINNNEINKWQLVPIGKITLDDTIPFAIAELAICEEESYCLNVSEGDYYGFLLRYDEGSKSKYFNQGLILLKQERIADFFESELMCYIQSEYFDGTYLSNEYANKLVIGEIDTDILIENDDFLRETKDMEILINDHSFIIRFPPDVFQCQISSFSIGDRVDGIVCNFASTNSIFLGVNEDYRQLINEAENDKEIDSLIENEKIVNSCIMEIAIAKYNEAKGDNTTIKIINLYKNFIEQKYKEIRDHYQQSLDKLDSMYELNLLIKDDEFHQNYQNWFSYDQKIRLDLLYLLMKTSTK